MNTETMSLRKALGQKKLLDKQIKAMMSEKFVTSESAQTAVIDGRFITLDEEHTGTEKVSFRRRHCSQSLLHK